MKSLKQNKQQNEASYNENNWEYTRSIENARKQAKSLRNLRKSRKTIWNSAE
jgi:hypothetical protein